MSSTRARNLSRSRGRPGAGGKRSSTGARKRSQSALSRSAVGVALESADISGPGANGIGFPDDMTRRPHGADDLVRHYGALASPKGSRQFSPPPRTGRHPAVARGPRKRPGPPDRRTRASNGTRPEEGCRYASQRDAGREDAESVPFLHVCSRRLPRVSNVEERGAERQREAVVRGIGSMDHHLLRDGRVSPVQEGGLFRREPPALSETPFAVAGTEPPKRGIPGRRIARPHGRVCGDHPTGCRALQKPVCEEPVSVDPRQFRRVEDPRPSRWSSSRISSELARRSRAVAMASTAKRSGDAYKYIVPRDYKCSALRRRS